MRELKKDGKVFRVGDRVEIVSNPVWAGPGTVTYVNPLSMFITVEKDHPVLGGIGLRPSIGAFSPNSLKLLERKPLTEYEERVMAWLNWFNDVTDTK